MKVIPEPRHVHSIEYLRLYVVIVIYGRHHDMVVPVTNWRDDFSVNPNVLIMHVDSFVYIEYSTNLDLYCLNFILLKSSSIR
jgi:hypothetical protein